MRPKQTPPVRLSCLAEYITRLQKGNERALARVQQQDRTGSLTSQQEATARLSLHRELQVTLWEVETARKYKLTPSALDMIARLKPEQSSGVIEPLPGTAIWAMLDDAPHTAVYFSSIPHAWSSYQEQHPGVLNTYEVEVAERDWMPWTLEVMTPGGIQQRYAYYPRRQRWTLAHPRGGTCPTGRCAFLMSDQRDGYPNWYLCHECSAAFDHWTSWFPVALMAVKGEFAETEEQQEPTLFRERELRTVRVPGQTKVKDVSVLHTYQVVTFDISSRRRGHLPPGSHEEPGQPTWLEQAIADETVLYVSRHFENVQRTFRHERYVNMRGKTIEVRPFDKRIPMSVTRLKQTIHQAIATKEI